LVKLIRQTLVVESPTTSKASGDCRGSHYEESNVPLAILKDYVITMWKPRDEKEQTLDDDCVYCTLKGGMFSYEDLKKVSSLV
jgi:hypothetical protein